MESVYGLKLEYKTAASVPTTAQCNNNAITDDSKEQSGAVPSGIPSYQELLSKATTMNIKDTLNLGNQTEISFSFTHSTKN